MRGRIVDTTKLNETFGVEISGVDLRGGVDDLSFDRLVRLFDTHLLLLFRDHKGRVLPPL
jgi:alpha-ketoglutarate-dependent taurine dioxygenase